MNRILDALCLQVTACSDSFGFLLLSASTEKITKQLTKG